MQRGAGDAIGTAAGALLNHRDRLFHDRVFLVARQVAGDLVIVAVALDHVAAGEDRLHGLGEALGDRAAGNEGRLDVLLLEDAQQAVDRMVRAVLALAPHLVIEDAVLVRLDVLAALEIESEEHGGALAARPADQVVVMIFLEHGSPVGWRGRQRILESRAPPG